MLNGLTVEILQSAISEFQSTADVDVDGLEEILRIMRESGFVGLLENMTGLIAEVSAEKRQPHAKACLLQMFMFGFNSAASVAAKDGLEQMLEK